MRKTYSSLIERFEAPGPKRILSLDGGGIRGAITLGYLQKLEGIIQKRHNDPNMRLCDYFDLIGGTSTGAIIAACLAIGKSASEVKDLYLQLGGEIFGMKKGIFGITFWNKYDEKPLKKALQDFFGDIRFGDEGENGLKTGLCVITKRLDTFSTWPLVNHPKNKFFEENRFLVREVVRASSAAPSFFKPQPINLGNGVNGIFVDGGLSMMNNPALQLFIIATAKGYPFQWETGEQKIKVVSIGTGTRDKKLAADGLENPNLGKLAKLAPEQFMHDASELVETMMQYFSNSPTAREIDSNLGKMEDTLFSNTAALSYLRYNVNLEKKQLEKIKLNPIPEKRLTSLISMDKAENRYILAEIGEKAAQEQISESHFHSVFDI